ncbi:MAG TPA: DNA polymerase I [Rhodospirillales bacterium]|nr:DNA polymerase I [Rhodospirillales bacterium]
MNADKPRHVYLIDGSGFIFRAFHALPPMTRSDGTPVNAVYGFTSMLMKLLDDTDADYIAVIFDHARRTFRNDIYPDYKAHRPDPPEELIPQFALVREAVRAFNLAAVEAEGYEADDLIATYARLARAAGADVTIVSSDKDLMQLVKEGVVMFDAMRGRMIGPAEVREKFGVGPDKVVDVQALAGDSTDNVPGVPGIGVKTAAQLIEEYGDLDTLLARASEIKQPKRRQSLLDEAELARVSRELVRLKDDVPIDTPLDDFAVKAPEAEVLLGFLKAYGFKSLLSRVQSRLQAHVAPGSAPALATVPESGPAPENGYELVLTTDALAGWADAARAAGLVAVDTETTSLDAMRAELVGVSLALDGGRACYIPLAHKGSADQGALELSGAPSEHAETQQIPLADALAILKPLLEDPAVLKVGQNIKYDMHVFVRHDVHPTPVDDTMVLSFVLEGGLHGHGMDELARLHLGRETIKFADVAGTGKSRVTFDRVPIEAALAYAAEDADVTLALHRLLKPRLVPERLVSVYETLERPLIPVLRDMERAGIRVDAAELKRLSADFEKRLADLEVEVHALAGHEFNVGSPKQLGEVLFDEMSIPGGRRGRTGAYATGADVLDDLAAQGIEIAARMLDWRQLAKLKSTYADALIQEINPETGRVHTSYAMAGASTGRLASTDPNLQNIPVRTEEGRKIRRAFVAEDGHVLLSADYSQIELRLLAHVAGIDALKSAFANGLDIHALTASQVFGVPVEGMDPLVRRQAKAINFGIIYGISPFGLARQLGIGRSEAGQYIDAYFARYPGIREYMDRTVDGARKTGYVTTPFGRRCHVPGIRDKSPPRRNFSERAAINAPLQGGAADIIKRAMIRIPGALEGARLNAVMLLQVHDELIFEVPEGEADETSDVVRGVMESAAYLDVPLVVDTGCGSDWSVAH